MKYIILFLCLFALTACPRGAYSQLARMADSTLKVQKIEPARATNRTIDVNGNLNPDSLGYGLIAIPPGIVQSEVARLQDSIALSIILALQARSAVKASWFIVGDNLTNNFNAFQRAVDSAATNGEDDHPGVLLVDADTFRINFDTVDYRFIRVPARKTLLIQGQGKRQTIFNVHGQARSNVASDKSQWWLRVDSAFVTVNDLAVYGHNLPLFPTTPGGFGFARDGVGGLWNQYGKDYGNLYVNRCRFDSTLFSAFSISAGTSSSDSNYIFEAHDSEFWAVGGNQLFSGDWMKKQYRFFNCEIGLDLRGQDPDYCIYTTHNANYILDHVRFLFRANGRDPADHLTWAFHTNPGSGRDQIPEYHEWRNCYIQEGFPVGALTGRNRPTIFTDNEFWATIQINKSVDFYRNKFFNAGFVLYQIRDRTGEQINVIENEFRSTKPGVGFAELGWDSTLWNFRGNYFSGKGTAINTGVDTSYYNIWLNASYNTFNMDSSAAIAVEIGTNVTANLSYNTYRGVYTADRAAVKITSDTHSVSISNETFMLDVGAYDIYASGSTKIRGHNNKYTTGKGVYAPDTSVSKGSIQITQGVGADVTTGGAFSTTFLTINQGNDFYHVTVPVAFTRIGVQEDFENQRLRLFGGSTIYLAADTTFYFASGTGCNIATVPDTVLQGTVAAMKYDANTKKFYRIK